jgi:hypothetical protein
MRFSMCEKKITTKSPLRPIRNTVTDAKNPLPAWKAEKRLKNPIIRFRIKNFNEWVPFSRRIRIRILSISIFFSTFFSLSSLYFFSFISHIRPLNFKVWSAAATVVHLYVALSSSLLQTSSSSIPPFHQEVCICNYCVDFWCLYANHRVGFDMRHERKRNWGFWFHLFLCVSW